MTATIVTVTDPHGRPWAMQHVGHGPSGVQVYVVTRVNAKGEPLKLRTRGHRITFDPCAKMPGRVLSALTLSEAEQVLARVEHEGA
jgi:hypothetical protein